MARLGEIIDGKYEILREIGRGGMSVVYLSMDKRLNKQWAIKEFRKDRDDVSKQVALKSLLDEANLMKKLDHPTLPRIVDIIENNQTVYVVMDYIEGESLNKVLDAYGAQPQEAVIEWAKQLSNVLDYLHTQSPPVIYRDMKPANIMLKPDGTVRLIDFGIAREYKEGKAGDTEAIGTRGYAAPEQFGGKGQTDARTDIYSLGVTLYHLVTGKNPAEPPYELYPIRHWDPNLSSGLEWLIQKCTQLNPNDRYQSCAEVTYVLEHLKEFDVEYRKKRKRRFNLFLTSTALTLVFALTSGVCFYSGSQAKKNSYNELMADERYEKAIEVDNENVDAYVALAEQLYNNLPLVSSGNRRSEGSATDAEITIGDLLSFFPTDRMATFKKEHPSEYADIQFCVGYIIWTKYDGTDIEAMKNAIPYFKNVVEIADAGGAGAYAGLSEMRFNLAKTYYLLSYSQLNRDKLLKQNPAGDKLQLSETEKNAGLGDGNFYENLWGYIKDALEVLKNEEMTAEAKLISLKRIYYILDENHRHFFGTQVGDAGISYDEVSELIGDVGSVLNSIPDSDEIFKTETDGQSAQSQTEAKNSLKDDINKKLLPKIENFYAEAELAEVK